MPTFRCFHRGTGALFTLPYEPDLTDIDTLEKLRHACYANDGDSSFVMVPTVDAATGVEDPDGPPLGPPPTLRRTASIAIGQPITAVERLNLTTGQMVDASGYDLRDSSNDDLARVYQHVTLPR